MCCYKELKRLYGLQRGDNIQKGVKGTVSLSDSSIERSLMSQDNIAKEGWIKHTTMDEPRLSEIILEYESLGYEVHLEPVKLEDLGEECKKCYQSQIDKLKNVYVRKSK